MSIFKRWDQFVLKFTKSPQPPPYQHEHHLSQKE
jgi:hypothetical protein